jgi:pyrimidine-specific ribonucleoside hydrolase
MLDRSEIHPQPSAMIKRRELLIAGVSAFAGLTPAKNIALDQTTGRAKGSKIPLVHITDLYHPPQDPDDHVDLATLAALEEYDLRGVVLDVTRKFLQASPAGFDIQRDPGFAPVAQLGYLLGRSISVAAGPSQPLNHPEDDVADRPSEEQAGVRLLLHILEECQDRVMVSVVGSARVLTAAYNRNPELLGKKVRSVLLNAGSTAGPKREWNVGLDPEAYTGLWRTGLPIHWYPCATEQGAFNPDHERGTYWKSTHAAIFRDLAPPLRAWFAYALTGDRRGDIIGVLDDEISPSIWNRILAQERNMWSTVSLVMAAVRVLAETSKGWRFIPSSAVATGSVWPWRLDPIIATVNPGADVQWRLAGEGGNALLFGRERGSGFGEAMAEALAGLLASLRG